MTSQQTSQSTARRSGDANPAGRTRARGVAAAGLPRWLSEGPGGLSSVIATSGFDGSVGSTADEATAAGEAGLGSLTPAGSGLSIGPAGNPVAPITPMAAAVTADPRQGRRAAADPSTPAAPIPAAEGLLSASAVTPGTLRSSGVMGGPSGTSASPASGPDFDGLLVSWNPQVSAAERAQVRQQLNLELREQIQTAAMNSAGAGVIDWIQLPPGLTAERAIELLAKRPGVQGVEKNWRLSPQAVSNDFYYTNGSLWGMYGDSSTPTNSFGSQAAEAWAAGYTGSSSVYVGIIDEGYQYTHPDLAPNAGVNPGEVAGDGLDNDGNGYIDDVYGWDFDGNNNGIYDGTGDDHGTHVAGTIGARGGDGAGVAGVNWDVQLLNAKFLGTNGGTTANAIKAVDYFTDLKNRGLNIVATNNSWGGGGYSQLLYDAIERANQSGILFIAAAGNGGSDGVGDNNDTTANFPSNYTNSNVIAVAAITSSGSRSSFSNYGATSVDLGAPGSGVWSTVPSGSYASYSGTSMATPHVTGAAALLESVYPTATAAQIKQALLEGAAPTTSLNGITVSGGRLDIPGALARLAQLVSPVDPNAPTYAVSAPASVNEGTGLTFSISTTNVASGSTLFWKIIGTGITNADFTGLPTLQGSLTLDGNGRAALATTLAADLTTEGNETLGFELYSDSAMSSRVANATVIINDSSRPAGVTLWGSNNNINDTITGGVGPDRLAGVRSTGTTAADLGAGQWDTLTGQADADVFLLGDSRGVFYDDRQGNTTGSNDYALITDFLRGIDKLQVRAGNNYVYTVSSGNLSLYWDRNNNGQVNANGNNRDELIAVLQGVSALATSDLIAV